MIKSARTFVEKITQYATCTNFVYGHTTVIHRLPTFIMARLLLCLVSLVIFVAVHTSTVGDSNRFLDIILEDKLPRQIRDLKNVYPFVKVPYFKFKIKSTGITNRELKVKVKYGMLNGFDTGVRRIGECHPPVLIKGNVTVSCLLELKGINASLITEVKGETFARKEKTVPVNVTVVDTVANFEATAYPGHPGTLRTFHIEQIRFHTVYDRRLSLNSERQRGFNTEIERGLRNILYDLLYTDYKKALEKAVESMPFPRA